MRKQHQQQSNFLKCFCYSPGASSLCPPGVIMVMADRRNTWPAQRRSHWTCSLATKRSGESKFNNSQLHVVTTALHGSSQTSRIFTFTQQDFTAEKLKLEHDVSHCSMPSRNASPFPLPSPAPVHQRRSCPAVDVELFRQRLQDSARGYFSQDSVCGHSE